MSEIVNIKIAKKLKEKGFREKCMWHYYDDTKDIYKSSSPQCYNYGGNTSDAPTISQVLKWLRNKKDLYLGITYVPQIDEHNDFYFPTIQHIGKFMSTVYTKPTDNFKTYEEAAFTGIEYIINNLI